HDGMLSVQTAVFTRCGANRVPLCGKSSGKSGIKRYPLNKGDSSELTRHMHAKRPRSLEQCVDCLREYNGPLKGNNGDSRRSNEFADIVLALFRSQSVDNAIHTISENFEGLQKDYGKSIEDIFYSDPPFMYLAEYSQRYGDDYSQFHEDLEKAIATLARLPDEEVEQDSTQEQNWKLPLHLMTALRAKGKEYDVVVILDANQGIWPSKLASTPEQLEQERRLFYVAITRTRKRLIVLVNDSILGHSCMASQYLTEMGLTPRRLRTR
ncbi:MAG: 3'-5' exonuclease, partial [Bythopirellula sp.]|nr:3'-5' exonuclease [Bythopirellula sp.]